MSTPLSSLNAAIDVPVPEYPTVDIISFLPPGTTLNPNNWAAPENEPYHPPKIADQLAKSSWERFKGSMSDFCKVTAYKMSHVANFARQYFHETNFELLYSLASNTQEIRVTKSWFLPQSKDLYSLSNNSIKFWSTWNFWKKVWNEGKITGYAQQTNVVKVAEYAPRILFGKAQEVFLKYNQERKQLTRKAAVILNDKNYGKVEYLEKIVKEFEQASNQYRNQMIDLVLSKFGESPTPMTNVRTALTKSFESNFTTPDLLGMKKIYQLDNLKAYLSKFFKRMDQIADRVNLTYDRVLLDPPKHAGQSEAEILRKKLYYVAAEQNELSGVISQELDGYYALIQHFEKERGI
jgi:hypothetical protein